MRLTPEVRPGAKMSTTPNSFSRALSTRRSPRLVLDCAVRVRLDRPEFEEPLHLSGRCRDISEHGVCIELSTGLDEGEIVTVIMKMEGDMAEQHLSAIVRYTNNGMHGLEFLGLLPPRKAALRQVVQTQAQRVS